MAKTIRGLSIEISGNTVKLNQAIKSSNEQTKLLNSELKKINNSLKFDPKNVELLKQKQDVLTESIKATSEKLNILKKAQEEAKKAFENGDLSAEEFRKIQREVIKTDDQLANLKVQLKDLNSIDFNKVSDNMKKFGDKATKYLTLPIAAATTASVKFAMDFEQSLSKVNTIADTSSKSLDEIKNEILDLSNKTGIASTELSESVYQAISAGTETANAVRVVEIATKAAVAGFTDTTTAVDGLTTVINTYGLSIEEADGLANKFLVTQNLGKTTFGELASSIGKVAPIAATLNVTTDELLSSLASLTANGINTSEAITSLKAAFSNIVKPSQTAIETASQLGLEFDSTAIKTKGFAGFLEDVKKKTNGNVDVMAKLFGSTEAVNTILSLTSDQGMQLFNKSLNEMQSNTTLLDESFDKIQNTTQSKFNKGLQQLKNSAIELGYNALPIINKFIDGISGLVNWFNKLDSSQQKMIGTIALVIAAIGPLSSGIGNITGIISNLHGILPSLGALLSPTGLIISGITLATTAIVGLGIAASNGTKSFTQMMNEMETSDDKLQKINDKFDNIEENTTESMKRISDEFTKTLNEISNATEQSNVDELWNQLLSSYENILDTRKKGIMDKYEEINNIILSSAYSEEKKAELIEESNRKQAEDLDSLKTTYDEVYAKIIEIVGENGENLKNLTGEQQVELFNLKSKLEGVMNVDSFDTSNTELVISEATQKLINKIDEKLKEGKEISSRDWGELKTAMLEDSKSVFEEIESQIASNQSLYDFGIIPKDQYEKEKTTLEQLKVELSNGITETVDQIAKTTQEIYHRSRGFFSLGETVYSFEESQKQKEIARNSLNDLGDSIVETINEIERESKNAWSDYSAGTMDALEIGANIDNIRFSFEKIGQATYDGFLSGNPTWKYSNKGFEDGRAYVNAFREAQDTHSPSREMKELGFFALKGFLESTDSKKFAKQGLSNAQAYVESFRKNINGLEMMNQSIDKGTTNLSNKEVNLSIGTFINNTDKDTESLANDLNFMVRKEF